MEIVLNNVSKKINEDAILDNVSLRLEGGKIYGLFGRNGSGKTMFLRVMSGLMAFDSGTVSYDGKILHKDMEILPNMGMIIENTGFWKSYTGKENLKTLARINKKIDDNRIDEILKIVGLESSANKSVRQYSLGMRQRLAIAQALMEYPEVLLLDEPSNGLDENGVTLFRKLMLKEKNRGAIILLVSHNNEDVNDILDVKLKIDTGKIVEV